MTLRSGHRVRLTPGRVRSMTFRLARLGRRGYDEDDVRDFCDRVEEELSLLLEERSGLLAEVRRLRVRAQAQNQAQNQARTGPALPLGAPPMTTPPRTTPALPGPAGGAAAAALPPAGSAPGAGGSLGAPVSVPAPSPPYDTGAGPRYRDPNDQALRILAKAQQTAERYVSDAHAYSREVAHDAQRRRERILAEASAKATHLLEQAHQAAIRSGLRPDISPGRQPAALAAPPADYPATGYRDPAPGTTYDRADPQSTSTPRDVPVPYDTGATYNTPATYDAPATYDDYPSPNGYSGHTSQSGPPPADYSTVIDYPGPAADYHPPRPDYRDAGGRDRNKDRYRDKDRYPDGYRGYRGDESRFPF